MGKTTNILDLNNRLTKVEKENVAQNSYTSLKNKPKINSVTLTGNKSLADIGAAAAGDITNINTAIGDMSDLDTTAADLVGAINEVNYGLNNVMKVPDQGADVLGYGAKDGSNVVTVNLGSNNIANYDFLEFMISYYESGIACYGYINVPTHTMRYVFGSDAGVPMFVVTAVNSTGAIGVVLNDNSNVKFKPYNGIEPQGNYYVVRGVKLRK